MEVTEKLPQMLQGQGAYGQHNVQEQRLSCCWWGGKHQEPWLLWKVP